MPSNPLDPEAPIRHAKPMRLLVTAGPTHEPLDEVRYIANRSSGHLGIELATAAAASGHDTTLLFGPGPSEPSHTNLRTLRFRTTEDLRELLASEFPVCEVLIMAAAVADYRPILNSDTMPARKLPRTGSGLTLNLEMTPDLVAECAASRKPGQLIIGFALEPEDRLLESAREKLDRKGIDAIVANSLGTMESPNMENARLITPEGILDLGPSLSKPEFAQWLIRSIESRRSIGTWTHPAKP